MKNKPWVSYAFLAIQIVIYLAMTLYYFVHTGQLGGSENSQILYLFGAEYAPAILQGHEYWRLITPIFVHIGFVHLLFNSVTLYYVAPPLEQWLGHFRFAVLYLVSGICGNLMSLVFGNPQVISAGASTSLFGLFAAYFALKFISQHPYIQALARQYATFIVVNIIFNLFDSRVDIWGHLGGLIGGFILMLLLGRKIKNNFV